MLDVIIVGGGPVGLFTAILLCQAGLEVQVVERRAERNDHSRAIGIHPPALQALAGGGVAGGLVARGVKILDGVARSGGRAVTRLSFAGLPGPYPFVLAVPQVQTEQLLESRLEALRPGTLQRGIGVLNAHDVGDSVLVTMSDGAVRQARLVIGADGGRSTVRDSAGIRTTLKQYPDTYLMGDFTDNTADRTTAALYLEPDGIVESFPLPGGIRRWVVRTPSLTSSPGRDRLAGLIAHRTGVVLDANSNTMLSAFEVRRRLARRFVRGRAVLVGDAAHEVSPIGGQGMNLGWLDAAELVPIIRASLVDGTNVARDLRAFDARRRRASVMASRQAHLNMALGRPLAPPLLAARNRVLARLNAAPAVHDSIARTFTMQ